MGSSGSAAASSSGFYDDGDRGATTPSETSYTGGGGGGRGTSPFGAGMLHQDDFMVSSMRHLSTRPIFSRIFLTLFGTNIVPLSRKKTEKDPNKI